MAKNSLVMLGVVLGILGLLLIGGAYLAFTDAAETYEDTEWVSAGSCENLVDLVWCWIPIPSSDLGFSSCIYGIFVVALAIGILFSGSIFGVVGATLDVSNTEDGVAPLPPPDPPAKPDVVDDEFAEIERELDSLED